jgi:hypothetical protein
MLLVFIGAVIVIVIILLLIFKPWKKDKFRAREDFSPGKS